MEKARGEMEKWNSGVVKLNCKSPNEKRNQMLPKEAHVALNHMH